MKGLRKNDFILTVDDTSVQNMDKTQFSNFVRTAGGAAETNDRPLVLQVINEDQVRSRSSTKSDTIEPPKPVDEVYPKLRICTIPVFTHLYIRSLQSVFRALSFLFRNHPNILTLAFKLINHQIHTAVQRVFKLNI